MTQEQKLLLEEVEKTVLERCKGKKVTPLELRKMVLEELIKRQDN
jgi:hypothetical protein